jgi:tRNA threonylcarbamoyladenosine biosynthesis protein TsaB
MLAQGALRTAGAAQVLAAIDARMGEVYFQPFGRDANGLPQAVAEAVVCAPVAVAACAGEWTAAGTGWGTYPAALAAATGAVLIATLADALPHARDALGLAHACFARGEGHDAATLAPIYLRNQIALTLVEQAARRAAVAKSAK